MLRRTPHLPVRRGSLCWRPIVAAFMLAIFCLIGAHSASASTVPPGFTETPVTGPWDDAVGITFETNGRMWVWERTGKVWFKDPNDPSPTLLLNISDEVGAWEDHGMLGFALDPNFRVNGYIYLFYIVDREHLLYFGTPDYDPNANLYNAATIGRVTRYTCTSADGFRSVSLASRFILIGETKQTGLPILSYSHGVGSLVFGEDGTLLLTTGDGATASAVDQGGSSDDAQGLADQIIRPKEAIGALRAQLVDCLNGKLLRIDPATGDGLPSNPYFDPANPRAPRSRVWALGLRNPCRMSLRPNTGSHFPADGNPGVFYVGIVGWNTLESLAIVTGPRQNFGWPIFEGLSTTPGYDGNVANQDAPNPLYPASGCSQYFTFANLLKEDTLAAAGQPPFANPCNTSQRIPTSIPQFLHTRPVLDWNHSNATTRTPIYGGSGQAQTANVGANGSPVSGTQFQGNCAIGGTWYTGTTFPTAYQDRYYFADWGQGLIKTLTLDSNDRPIALGSFASAAGAVVNIAQHPVDGSLYYISYNFTGATIQRLSYTGNSTPVAVASADHHYGPTPLAVQFSSDGSSDPDGQPITFSWNFGDGSPVSTEANPSHTFTAQTGVPTKFIVTLTVTDSGGLSAQKSLTISVNNTPPNVSISSPVNGVLYNPFSQTTVNLAASVSDAESSDAQLLYQWQVLLHHNDHNHGNPIDTNHVTTAVLEPTGCDGINIYYYRVLLTVTDPAGLATTQEVRLYPDCGPDTPPTISNIADQTIQQNGTTGPINFTVGDAEVAAANLQLTGTSSNPNLIPNGNIVFGGGGTDRTVTVTPALGQAGTATITVTVNDGPHDVSTNFVVTVNPIAIQTLTFNSAISIAIPDHGASSPYPSTLNIAGMSGTVTNVTVTLNNLTHTYVSDLDVLLVGPAGQKVLIFSDVGSGFNASNVTVTLSDAAPTSLPASGSFASGTYKPTDYTDGSAGGDNFPLPAPAAPYATALSAFNGQSANGIWSLYVFDDGPGDLGSFAGGWSLTVTSAIPGATPIPTPTLTPTPTPTPTPPPDVRTYDSGSGTDVVPANSTQVVVEIWYPGGGGSRSTGSSSQRGGGSGAYSKKSVPLTSLNWGQIFSYDCGTPGLGRTGSTGNGGAASGGSITDNLTNITIALIPGSSAQGGVNSGSGVGGTVPSGGDTNTAGNSTSTNAGAGAPNGGGNVGAGITGSVPGGGGGGGFGSNANGANGASGRCRFTYTIAIPSPAPSPTPANSPTPTPTASPTPTPINISGTISYCSNPVPASVPGVTLNLTGSLSGSTLSDAAGNYQLSSLIPGGSYTVTPSKSALTPGTHGIDTIDVIGTQRHFLNLASLPVGCRRDAADVNGDASINTVDVIAIQRFFLGFTSGIANSGKFQFNPATRSYSGIAGDQTGQNYDTLVFGDVASGFIYGP